MLRTLFAFLLLPCLFMGQLSAQDAKMDAFVDNLMSKMTLEEKLGQLNLIGLGYGAITGAAVNTGIQEKISDGHVGAVLNSAGPETLRRRCLSRPS